MFEPNQAGWVNMERVSGYQTSAVSMIFVLGDMAMVARECGSWGRPVGQPGLLSAMETTQK